MNKILFVILVLSLLFCSSCDKTDDLSQDTESERDYHPNHYLHEIYVDVMKNSLPPLDTSPNEPSYIEGGRADVNRLDRAPQNLVGEKVDLSVDVSEWDDNTSRQLVYCFREQDDGTGKLWVLYSNDVGNGDAIMLTLDTQYATVEELLLETAVWSGTVTAIDIVTVFDYMYPHQTVAGDRRELVQSQDGPIGYGWIAVIEEDTPMERLCYSCDSMDDITPFKITFERFGVLE